jgi:hypothetical protein
MSLPWWWVCSPSCPCTHNCTRSKNDRPFLLEGKITWSILPWWQVCSPPYPSTAQARTLPPTRALAGVLDPRTSLPRALGLRGWGKHVQNMELSARNWSWCDCLWMTITHSVPHACGSWRAGFLDKLAKGVRTAGVWTYTHTKELGFRTGSWWLCGHSWSKACVNTLDQNRTGSWWLCNHS